MDSKMPNMKPKDMTPKTPMPMPKHPMPMPTPMPKGGK